MELKSKMNVDKSIIKFLEANLKKETIPGYVATFTDGKNSHFIARGHKATYPKKEVINEKAIYDVASLTKIIVTTTIIMQLVEEKKVLLKDKIKSYLPDFSDSSVEIHNLLLHNSGLPSDCLLDPGWSVETYKSKVLSTSLDSRRKRYSDIGFIILGWIIEEVLEDSLEKIAEKRIIRPLDLKDSGFNLKEDTKKFAPTELRTTGLKRGTVHDRKATYLKGAAGHAGWFTTVSDLNAFLKACLFPEKSNGVISKDYHAFMNRYMCDSRTLGWEKKVSEKSNTFLYHTGFTGVFMYINLSNKKAGAVLTNSIHPNRNETFSIERTNLLERIFQNG